MKAAPLLFRLAERAVIFEAVPFRSFYRWYGSECVLTRNRVRLRGEACSLSVDPQITERLAPYEQSSDLYAYSYRFRRLLYTNLPDLENHPLERHYLLLQTGSERDPHLLTLLTLDEDDEWISWDLVGFADPIEPALHAALRGAFVEARSKRWRRFFRSTRT